MATLTRIHLGRGIDESGVQYEADDGAGGTTTQKGFVTLPKEVTDAVWAAAETALAEQLALFPPDMPLAEVASALRKKRDAEAAANLAKEEKRAAEQARDVAEQVKAEAERVAAKAEESLTTIIAEAGQVAARKTADEALLATWMGEREAAKAEALAAGQAREQAEAARQQAEKAKAAALAAVEQARAEKAKLDTEIAAARAAQSAEKDPA